jgi:hypothetical protein
MGEIAGLSSLLLVRFRPQEKAMCAGRVIELSNDLSD